MDIRTKLVFSLVAVALASMTAFGFVIHGLADNALRSNRLGQLESLAESRALALSQISAGWVEQVGLLASRTQLRASLRAVGAGGAPAASDAIQRIVEDALGSSAVVRSLAVYDLDGRMVASAGDAGALPQSPARLPAGGQVAFEGLSLAPDGDPHVDYAATLESEGESVGTMRVSMSAPAVRELVEDRTGLGETGEIVLILSGPDGPSVLRRARSVAHGEAGVVELPSGRLALGRLEWAERIVHRGDGAYTAAAGDGGPILDERQKEVWAAVRGIPELGWSVVAELDADEARAPIAEFRERVWKLALALGAIAILFGGLLGLHFAKPIHDLAKTANEIRSGDFSARAEVTTEDEVGLLGRTFNQMAQELEDRMLLLREFERFFEVSVDMLCIAGTDAFFKRVNPAFEKTLGWTAEELLSCQFLEFVHPDDVESTVAEVQKLSEGIRTISFENRYRCRDGSYKHLLWAAHPEPTKELIYAVARDVTERKAEADRFRLAIMASSTAMLMVDPTGEVVLANHAAERLFAYEAGALLGKPVRDLVPIEWQGPARFPGDAAPGEEAHQIQFTTGRRRDGTEVPVRVELSSIPMPTGRHLLASVVDLSAQKRAEEEIHALSRRLEHAEAQLRTGS